MLVKGVLRPPAHVACVYVHRSSAHVPTHAFCVRMSLHSPLRSDATLRQSVSFQRCAPFPGQSQRLLTLLASLCAVHLLAVGLPTIASSNLTAPVLLQRPTLSLPTFRGCVTLRNHRAPSYSGLTVTTPNSHLGGGLNPPRFESGSTPTEFLSVGSICHPQPRFLVGFAAAAAFFPHYFFSRVTVSSSLWHLLPPFGLIDRSLSHTGTRGACVSISCPHFSGRSSSAADLAALLVDTLLPRFRVAVLNQ